MAQLRGQLDRAARGENAYLSELASSENTNKVLATEAERISHEAALQQNQANQTIGQTQAQIYSLHGAQQAMKTEGLLLEAALDTSQSNMQVHKTQLQEAELAVEQARLQIQNLQLEKTQASEKILALEAPEERYTIQAKEHSKAQSLMEDQMLHMQDMLATLMGRRLLAEGRVYT